jgi:hypothetical protein
MLGKMRTSGRRERAAIEKVPLTEKERTAAESGLLLDPQNRVFCRLGNSEFDDGLRRNLYLLLRPGIEARACFPLLLHQLAKTGQDKFAVLFGRFVGEVAVRSTWASTLLRTPTSRSVVVSRISPSLVSCPLKT